jgi:O-antigen ligase
MMPLGGAQAVHRPFGGRRSSGLADAATAPARSPGRGARSLAARVLRSLTEFCSIEASFALFLFAGRYKTLPELRGFPVDFTLLFCAVTFCLIAWAIISGRMKPIPLSLTVLLMILFSEVAVASVLWSSLDPLNTDKALRFLLLTSTSFYAAQMLGQDRERRTRLIRIVIWLSCAILLYYAYYRYVLGIGVEEGELNVGKYPADSNNYLEYGAHASILFIICLTLAAFGSLRQLAVAVFASGAALFALVTIGGRGPLASALLAFALLALGLLWRSARPLRRLWRLAALVSGLLALAAAGYLVFEGLSGSGAASEQQFRTLDRYQMQLSREDTSSMDERVGGRDLAFRLWLEKPILGWGLGEFRVKDSYLQYPHNLLLEILMEMGIVGALLFFSVCTVAVRDCLRLAKDQACGWTEAAIVLLFLTELASHFTVQGYLADDRIFLAYMGLVIGCRTAAGPSSGPAPRSPARRQVWGRTPVAHELLMRRAMQ